MATRPRIAKRPAQQPKEATVKPEVVDAALRLIDLKRERKAIDEEIAATTAIVQGHLEKTKEPLELGDGKFTLVKPTTVVTDEAKLKRLLGAPMWNKVTTRVLDNDKVKAFVKAGDISSRTLAAASEVVDRTAYVKVTLK